MAKNNQLPSIPPNYVTLSQLQERWLKEKQQLKEKEKKQHESQNQQQPRHPQNENAQIKIEAPRPKQGYENRRSNYRKYWGRNRNFKDSFSGASPGEPFDGAVAVVEGAGIESTGNVMKSKDLGSDIMNMTNRETRKKKKKMRKKKREDKVKMVKDGETRTQGEEEVVEREVDTPPTKSEKKSIPVRRFGVKRDMRLDFRPRNANLVENSDCAVEKQGEVKDVMQNSDFAVEMEGEKSEGTVEIERKIGDLCIEEESDKSEIQNNTFDRRNTEYRGRERIVDNRYSKHRGYDRTVNRSYSEYTRNNGVLTRQNTEYRGSNGGGYQCNGHFERSYQRFNSVWRKARDSGNELVWVMKKGKVGATDDA